MHWLSINLLLIIASITSACVYNSKTYADAEQWIEREHFVMRCNIYAKRGWEVTVVGCLSANGSLVEPGTRLDELGVEVACEQLEDGTIRIRKQVSKRARCGDHLFGEKWTENSFVYECKERGREEIVACVTKSGRKIAVDEAAVEGQFKMICEKLGNLYRLRPSRLNKTFCLDQFGRKHDFGSWWLVGNGNFNKTCAENGYIRISNCVTKSGIKIPIGHRAIDGSFYARCERSKDGTVWLRYEFEEQLDNNNKTAKNTTKNTTKKTETKLSRTVDVKETEEQSGAGCTDSNDQMRKIGEWWIEDGNFNKTCDSTGSIRIVNCVFESEKISLNSNKTQDIDGKVFTCEVTADGHVTFGMKSKTSLQIPSS